MRVAKQTSHVTSSSRSSQNNRNPLLQEVSLPPDVTAQPRLPAILDPSSDEKPPFAKAGSRRKLHQASSKKLQITEEIMEQEVVNPHIKGRPFPCYEEGQINLKAVSSGQFDRKAASIGARVSPAPFIAATSGTVAELAHMLTARIRKKLLPIETTSGESSKNAMNCSAMVP